MPQVDIVERTFHFGVSVINLCQFIEKQTDVSRTLARQLLRSGTSIGANVEEAQAGQSTPDFISKMNIALKEARETHYWLRLMTASRIIFREEDRAICQEADEIKRIIAVIIINTKKSSK
jgi:four helix bundle protein